MLCVVQTSAAGDPLLGIAERERDPRGTGDHECTAAEEGEEQCQERWAVRSPKQGRSDEYGGADSCCEETERNRSRPQPAFEFGSK
ncbi:MAG: hypothetical protein QF471_05685 [Phycisphaerales bacterium]|nr:hypothetical protein [Phycisphaerales bacterium]